MMSSANSIQREHSVPGFIMVTVLLFVWLGIYGSLSPQLLLSGEPLAPANLWREVPPDTIPAQPTSPRRPWVLRDRAIALNPQLLLTLKDAAARPHPPVFIELFDGNRYELDITSTISRINDTAVIRGLLKHTPHGDFTFIFNGSVMAGTIHVGERLFTIEHISNGHHQLLELDPATVPPD
jgi:hypothetical protein